MKIQTYTVQHSLLPLSVPFRTALREVTAVDEIRVTITTDTGLVGMGSAAPTAAITGETLPSIIGALEQHILPALYPLDLEDRHQVFNVLRRSIVGNTSAKAAVDIALHDLYAQSRNASLLTYLGGIASPLWTDATVSLDSVETMQHQAESLVAEGFKHLKIKLGGHDGHDVERVIAIRETIPGDIVLWLDPNQAWTVRESLAACEALAEWGVEFVEQPVPAQDLTGLRAITVASPIPIAADESVFGLEHLRHILDMGAADIINVKLMKSGGLAVACTMAELAASAGVALMVGSMMEGMASVTAAAAFAMAYRAKYVDLDAGYFLRDAKVNGGLTYQGGQITVPTGLGLGVCFTQEGASR